jgi:hypothetical protein
MFRVGLKFQSSKFPALKILALLAITISGTIFDKLRALKELW